MTAGYAVAGLGDIGEISGGSPSCRPVRYHFGITSFGINAWTAAVVGDRILNAHDEAGDAEELYLVHCAERPSSSTAIGSTRRRVRSSSRHPG